MNTYNILFVESETLDIMGVSVEASSRSEAEKKLRKVFKNIHKIEYIKLVGRNRK